MAQSIGVKVGVDGEAEFKRSLGNLATEAKALKAELTALKTSTAEAGKEQEHAQEIAEKYAEVVANQEERVKLLNEKLTAAKEKYGENSTEVNKLRADLANAKTALNQLKTEQEQATTTTEEFTEAEEEAGQAALTAGDLIKASLISDAIVSGLKKLADLAKEAAEALYSCATEAAAYADSVLTMATISGLSTDQIQEMSYMAELVDVSLSTMTGSMSKLTRAMSNAQKGSEKESEAFRRLGVRTTNFDGSLRSSSEVFFDVIDALGQMEEGTERDALAMDLFGRSAQELNPLIKAGSDGMRKFASEAHQVGYVLDSGTLDQLGALDDAFVRLGNLRTTIRNRLGSAMAPALERVLTKLTEFAQRVDWTMVGEKLGAALETGAGKLIEFLDKIDIDQAAETITKIAEAIISAISYLLEHADEIIKLVRDVGIGLIAGKTVNAAGTVVTAGKNIFSGVAKLFGGAGAASAPATAAAPAAASAAATSAGTGGLFGGLSLASMIALPATLLGFGAYGAYATVKERKDAVAAAQEEAKSYDSYALDELKAAEAELTESFKAAAKKYQEVDEAEMWASLAGIEPEGGYQSNYYHAEMDAAQARLQYVRDLIAAREELKDSDLLLISDDDLTDLKVSWDEIAATTEDKSAEVIAAASSWGEDMMQSMASGIVSGANSALIPAAVGAARALWSIFHHSEPETGPLADDSEWMPDMMQSMAEGIRDNSYLVRDAMSALAFDLSDTMGGIRGGDSISYGGVTVVFQVQPGQDGRALFDEFSEYLSAGIAREGAVYA